MTKVIFSFFKKQSAAGFSFLALSVLPPSAICLASYLLSPYFPHPWDDGLYWSQTIRQSFSSDPTQLFRAIYLDREGRPGILPVLGLPLYVLTRSIATTTMLLYTGFIAIFSASAYGILRQMRTRRPTATLISITLSFLPVVFRSSQAYLLELPLLTFCASALRLLILPKASGLSQVCATCLLAGSFCLRPLEAGFFWSLLATHCALAGKVERRRTAVMVCAIILAVAWFAPTLPMLRTWITSSLVDNEYPWPPESLSAAGRVACLLDLVSRLFSFPLLAFFLMAATANFFLENRLRSLQLFSAVGLFLPLIFSLLISNRGTATQERYFILGATLWAGVNLALISNHVRGVALAGLILACWKVPPAMGEIDRRNQASHFWRRSCKAAFAPFVGVIPSSPRQEILFPPHHALSPLSCDVTWMEKGKFWRFHWLDGHSTGKGLNSYFFQKYDGLVQALS